jgi:hypothetical protein
MATHEHGEDALPFHEDAAADLKEKLAERARARMADGGARPRRRARTPHPYRRRRPGPIERAGARSCVACTTSGHCF